MNTFKLIGIVLICFSFACGDADEKRGNIKRSGGPKTANNDTKTNNDDSRFTCVVKGDCGPDQVCEESFCVDKCSTNSDCAKGRCEPSALGTFKFCKEPTKKDNNDKSNNKNTNNAKTESYQYYMIKDLGKGNACTSEDPGSDLMWISLNDNLGSALDWGKIVSATKGSGNDANFNDSTILNGSSPKNIDAVMCTKFRSDSIYSMGCGGTLIFTFALDVVPDKNSLTIGEYGSSCGGASNDTYEVFRCTDVSAAKGDSTSCTVSLSKAEGISPFPIPK